MGLFDRIIPQKIKDDLARRKAEKAAFEAELQETLPYKLSFQCTSTFIHEKYDVTNQSGKTCYVLETSRHNSDKPYLKLYRADDHEMVACIKAKQKMFKGWVFTFYKGNEKIGTLTGQDISRNHYVVLSCLGCTIKWESQHLLVRDMEQDLIAEIVSNYYVRYITPKHRTIALLAFMFRWIISMIDDKEYEERMKREYDS